MKPDYRWVVLSCILVLTVASAAAWLTMDTTSPHDALSLETIGTGDIKKVVLVTGILKPAVQVNVGAQVNGQLRKLYVRQGEKVKKANCWRKLIRLCRSLI